MSLFLDFPAWMVYPFLFAMGATIGSFLNVVILRTPWKETLWEQWNCLSDKSSHCPRCKADIRWYDNIPIFGWLKLGGRCRNCRMGISPRYPIIETLNALLFVLLYWMEIPLGFNRAIADSCLFSPLGPWAYPGYGWMSPELGLHLQFFFHLALVEALLVASVIDLDHRIIPEITTSPITVFGVVVSAAIARVHLVPVWFQSSTLERDYGILFGDEWRQLLNLPAGAVVDGPIWVPAWITEWPHLHGLVVSLAGALMGYALIKLVRELGNRVLNRESMGIGDIYLMIAIGAFLGWQATIVAFFIAPVWGLLFAAGQRFIYRDDYIPYGPFLSLGALVTLLFWSSIYERTHRIFELGVILIPLCFCMVVLFVLSLLLVQGLKWMLGIPLGGEPEMEEAAFGPADQTAFFAGEFVNRWSGRWKRPDWDGNAAGRGQIHEERWRNGTNDRHGPPSRDLRQQ